MPILSGPLVVTESPAEVSSVQPVTSENYGSPTFTWIDPDGVTRLELSDTRIESPLFTTYGPAGWGAPPIELTTDPLPRGGDQVRHIRDLPRRMQWPLYIGGMNSYERFAEEYERIVEVITRTTEAGAPAWMRVTRPSGRYRQIACYYEEGLEGEAGENHRWAKPVVTLFCPDGFWAGDQVVRAERSFVPADSEGSGINFFSPFFRLRSSKVATGSPDDPAVEVFNPGSVDAWPVWELTGPSSKLTAINETVGTQFTLTYPLDAGQKINITTNRPSVRGPGGINLSRYIDWFNPAGTELWPVKKGPNKIRFQVDGAGPGTHVEMLFTPRHKTA